jgi:hypothetical protein
MASVDGGLAVGGCGAAAADLDAADALAGGGLDCSRYRLYAVPLRYAAT